MFSGEESDLPTVVPSADVSIRVENPAQVNSFAVDPTSSCVVLAARKGLFIMGLEDPYRMVKAIHYNSKWEVNDVEWNPNHSHRTLVAASNNQTALLWDVADAGGDSSGGNLQCVLHSHTRAISNLNWSPFQWPLLATCSVDGLIHIWDIRTPQRPSKSFNTHSGVTHVKWNRCHEHTFASAHEGHIRIWDLRVPGKAIKQIMPAHMSKVFGIDWSYNSPTDLISCGQDRCIKVWNINNNRETHTMSMPAPVWRARYVPMGTDAFVSLTLPHPPRNECNLSLWSNASLSTPVHTYQGYGDTIKDFDFRTTYKNGDDPVLQLVTWSKDQILRLSTIDKEALGSSPTGNTVAVVPAFTRELSVPQPPPASFTSESASLSMNPSVSSHLLPEPSPATQSDTPSQAKPMTLTQEFATVAQRFPELLSDANAGQRRCTVNLEHGSILVALTISFPSHYPNNAPPSFEFTAPTTLTVSQRASLKELLSNMAGQFVEKNQMCVVGCLEALINAVRQMGASVDIPATLSRPGTLHHLDTIQSDRELMDRSVDTIDESRLGPSSTGFDSSPYGSGMLASSAPFSVLSGSQSGTLKRMGSESAGKTPTTRTVTFRPTTYEKDHNVPFPRTSGAVFGGNDKLVFFNSVRSDQGRAGSGLARPASISRLYDYVQHVTNMQQRANVLRPGQGTLTEPDDTDMYTPLDDEPVDDIYFLQSYFTQTTTTPHQMAERKKGKKKQVTRVAVDLQVHIADVTDILPVSKTLAATYTLSGPDIPSICFQNARAAENADRPDLAEAWELAGLSADQQLCRGSAKQAIGDVPWAMHPFGQPLMDKLMRHYEKAKDTQMVAMLACVFSQVFARPALKTRNAPTPAPLWEGWKRYMGTYLHYGEILYRWQLLLPSAELLLYRPGTQPHELAIMMPLSCKSCQAVLLGEKVCRNCNGVWAVECAICRLAVRGLAAVCMSCEHGGHAQHMQAWFETYRTCPTGCGCTCTIDLSVLPNKKRSIQAPSLVKLAVSNA